MELGIEELRPQAAWRAIVDREEAEIVRRAVAGDRDALAKLLKQHRAAVRQALAGKIPARWQAVLSVDDVMQQTYVDVFLDIGRFDVERDGSFRGWLMTLAKRNLLDALRMLGSQKRGKEWRRVDAAAADESFVALYELLTDARSTPSQQAAAREVRAQLQRALELLPPTHRVVVQMCDLAGRSVQEVAASLNRTPGAVYMLRVRAHRELAELLGTPSQFFSGSA
jgi:RNA polymerase sigma-70 factor (subfamily 1)